MNKLEDILEKFDEVMNWLAKCDEKVNVSEVTEMIVVSLGHWFSIAKEKEPIIIDFLKRSEMSMTISVIMNLYSMTSKREDARRIMREIEGEEEKIDGKPN